MPASRVVPTIGLELWPIIAGLILGEVIAAPFAALITRHVPDRPLMIMVGAVIVLLSARGLVQVVRQAATSWGLG